MKRPQDIKLYGGLDRLSGEWVEAAIDQIKKTHLQKTDRRSPNPTFKTQLWLEFQEAEAKIEAMENPTARKRKLNDDRAESAKQREKRKEWRITSELQPHVLHNLQTSILKTGQRMRKQNPESLCAILHRIDGDS